MSYKNSQAGIMNPFMIPTIVLGVLVLGFGSLAIWAYMSYTDQKSNVDRKIELAVSQGKKSQSDVDQGKYLDQEKQPYRQFQGPQELSGVSFDYPKTWSVYVDKDGASNTFEAYLQPGAVPPVNGRTPYATRVSVISASYDSTLQSYASLVKVGKLKSSPVSINGQNGTRFDGNFNDNVRGAMVVFKVRDKSLKVSSEAPAFMHDYETAILASLKFNP